MSLPEGPPLWAAAAAPAGRLLWETTLLDIGDLPRRDSCFAFARRSSSPTPPSPRSRSRRGWCARRGALHGSAVWTRACARLVLVRLDGLTRPHHHHLLPRYFLNRPPQQLEEVIWWLRGRKGRCAEGPQAQRTWSAPWCTPSGRSGPGSSTSSTSTGGRPRRR